jgi:hypothetical protein
MCVLYQGIKVFLPLSNSLMHMVYGSFNGTLASPSGHVCHLDNPDPSSLSLVAGSLIVLVFSYRPLRNKHNS